ncbi:hypothetical protein FGO68_gene13023 [Halteria grandinella]|uniref:RING-type domain-containing protein n=1 Tax=Halteria grandinella TaxID=5974 RepID=A0A8J8P240_HALGN|nr:hypothetical protein FGO68_gene13023 [Halteria grandinella]
MILTECGHTFCSACISKFKVMEDLISKQCPLDKITSSKLIINYHLLWQIESSNKQKQEFRPTCEQHQGKEILFYDPSLEKLSCQQCLNQTTQNSTVPVIHGLHFISYDALKPQIIEKMNQ